MSAITSLTQNGIKFVCEAENLSTQHRDEFIVVQITDYKVFNLSENKNVKSR